MSIKFGRQQSANTGKARQLTGNKKAARRAQRQVEEQIAPQALADQENSMGVQSIHMESVTPEKAQEFLQANFVHNRPIQRWWVDYLADEMIAGRFQDTAQIHIAYRNGAAVMLNGQHTCLAIVKSGKTTTCQVRRDRVVESGQLAMTYAYGYDNGRKRTFTDGLGAYNVSEEVGLTRIQTENLSRALKFMYAGFKPAQKRDAAVPLTDMVEQIHVWAPFALRYHGEETAAHGSVRGLIEKQGALSVLLVTYRYKLSEAREFWNQILVPDQLPYEHPCGYARRCLEDSRGGHGTQPIKPNLLARQLARCWKAFILRERMGMKPRIAMPDAPIVIVGSPWDGQLLARKWVD